VPKRSAGILLFRLNAASLEVFLVHPGGPFWRNKDAGTWSIPKGEYADNENPLEAAKREFQEETGIVPHIPISSSAGAPLPVFEGGSPVPLLGHPAFQGEFLSLGEVKQTGGKLVTAWALEGDCDPSAIRSNTVSLEWPPKSGRQQQFPEVDRAAWFSLPEARQQILKSQLPLLDRLMATLLPRLFPHS
jgi:predicted NUDIX family NTP pyrophosphohydrolase